MKRRSRPFTLQLIALAVVASRAIAAAAQVTPCDVPGAGYTIGLGINARGDIVGQYGEPFGAGHSFLLRNGIFTTIDPPGSAGGSANGINGRGDVVGWYGANGTTHGYLLRRGHFTNVDVPGAAVTLPNGINTGGDIVGTYGDSEFGPFHGFLLRKDGSFATIDPPGSVHTEVTGINSQGDIIGFYSLIDHGPLSGFLLHSGSFASVPIPTPRGINSRGDIVGGNLLFSKNVVTELEGNFLQLFGINASGSIVGFVGLVGNCILVK